VFGFGRGGVCFVIGLVKVEYGGGLREGGRNLLCY